VNHVLFQNSKLSNSTHTLSLTVRTTSSNIVDPFFGFDYAMAQAKVNASSQQLSTSLIPDIIKLGLFSIPRAAFHLRWRSMEVTRRTLPSNRRPGDAITHTPLLLDRDSYGVYSCNSAIHRGGHHFEQPCTPFLYQALQTVFGRNSLTTEFLNCYAPPTSELVVIRIKPRSIFFSFTERGRSSHGGEVVYAAGLYCCDKGHTLVTGRV